ncbi:sensor histidine kinase KdpD [uncultured Coprobacter sp.]|uniref:sensor histidine kinase n=1 Tax=uncultured Coprobacter sp. TaxID=1720550 RepID=UPI0025EA8F04|nr:ATP-binding protein [uncultured Coprobacter sp.]
MINLVDNAIKYGGDEPWVKVVFYRENWDWVLTVTDRGIGMPERVLKRIFRQFYRVKDKKVKNKTGFGLGLAFAKKVVNAYGGEIRVESAPGKGSRFEVRIKAE